MTYIDKIREVLREAGMECPPRVLMLIQDIIDREEKHLRRLAADRVNGTRAETEGDEK